MCCFNRPIPHVGSTRILVSATKDGLRQVTVYENAVGETQKAAKPGVSGMYRDAQGNVKVGTAPPELIKQREAEKKAKEAENAKNAMILPAPLKAGEKIRLLDLSKDSFSFKALSEWFPKIQRPMLRQGRGAPSQRASDSLEVFSVGSYFISLAESLEDLDRIDTDAFKVSPNIKDLFSKHYSKGFGFVICSFNPNKSMKAHPIGYIHDLMSEGKLFVPTRHQHTEEVLDVEHFDHEIYSINTTDDGETGFSVEEVERKNAEILQQSFKPVKSTEEAYKKILKSQVLDPLYPQIRSLRQRTIQGKHDNTDFIFTLA